MQNRTVNSTDLKNSLRHLVRAKRPAFIHGSPGCGKSDVVQSLCNELGGRLYDIRLSQCEQTDLRGMPYYNKETNRMEWAPPIDLPHEEAIDYPVVFLFLDEINSAPPSVQAAAYQLVLNRRIGTYTLPDNCFVVAAGNREGDRGVVYKMPKPLSNRFVHFELRVDFDCWNEWAIQNGIHPDVVGFLNFSKDSLNQFDPKSPDHAFPTPRTWEYTSDILSDPEISEKDAMNLISGTIGEGTALKFMAHREVSGKLPTPTDILKGKVTKLQTNDVSAHYSLMTSMLYELKELYPLMFADNKKDLWHQYSDNILGFIMDNFGPEIQVMGMTMGLRTMNLPFDHGKMTNFKKFFDGAGKLVLRSAKM